MVERMETQQQNLGNMRVDILHEQESHSIPAIPDSGAEISVMGMEIVQRLGLELKQFEMAPQGLMVADGSPLTQNGYCDLVIQFCNKHLNMRTTISEDLGTKFIIGKEDLVKFGVINKEYPYPPGYSNFDD